MASLDTSERHAVVARLAGSPSSLLDVGGSPGGLAAFLPRTRVTVANVEPPADVLLGGVELPFPDASFDVVTSLDVLEHLPREQRPRHLEELVRVARRRVVVCCPLGTPEHEASEQALAAWYRKMTGTGHRFLEEHLERGLPTEQELRRLADGLPWRFEAHFHGDFRRVERLFRLGTLARRRPLAYVAARLRARPDTELLSEPGRFTNRIFLVGSPLTEP
jgi:SAM-dependent methyltransferase